MRGLEHRNNSGPFYVVLGAFTLALLGALAYTIQVAWVLGYEHAPNVRAANRIKLDSTLAHLWFEESISGDRHEQVDEVWQLLDSAEFYTRAMLLGDEDAHGVIIPLHDLDLHGKILEVEGALKEFRSITNDRLMDSQQAAAGTAIDQEYDAVFRELLSLADEVELRLHQVIQDETNFVRRVQLIVMAAAAALSLLVGLMFARYTRERRQAERAVRLRVRAEEEARESLDRLAHLARLATMNELAAGIAHELNQPLAAIMMSAGVCRRLVNSDQFGSEDHLSAMALIEEQVARAGEVIRRLRSFVSASEISYESVDVNELVRSVVKLAEFDTYMINSTVELNLAENIPLVEADAVQIQQVLLNLVRNGVDAMREAGNESSPIVIRTRVDANGGLEVSVVDQGTGIPESLASEVFEPFVSTKESGMGVGLSISRSIIEAHGGKIWHQANEESPGTTFSFSLPAATGGL